MTTTNQPEPAEDLAQNLRDAITYSSDTGSPVLAALRDLIASTPGRSGDELAAARVLLAAHARELSALIYSDVLADRERNPDGGNDGRNHVRRGGMMTAQQTLDRYADDLDAAAEAAEPGPLQMLGEALRREHREVDGSPDSEGSCIADGCDWPCPTMRALYVAEAGEQQ